MAKNVEEDNHHLQLDEAETARSAVCGRTGDGGVYGLQPAVDGQDAGGFAGAGRKAEGLGGGSSERVAGAGTGSAAAAGVAAVSVQRWAGFEQAVLVKAGRKRRLQGRWTQPPSSSFEIMNPDAYMEQRPVPVLRLPDIHPLMDAEYTPYDVGMMGELDVRILTELFGGQEMATALTPAWNGGLYYAAQRKSAVTAAEKDSTASIGLLYYSRWKNEDSARSFMRVYVGTAGEEVLAPGAAEEG